jgi:hypothetical protein
VQLMRWEAANRELTSRLPNSLKDEPCSALLDFSSKEPQWAWNVIKRLF